MSLYENLLEKLNGHEYSNYFVANCVFHDDHSPSMFVYDDGNFRCAACGKRGTLKFLAGKVGDHFLPRRDTVSSRILPQWKSWEREFGDLDEIVGVAHRSLVRHPQLQGYLKKRKYERFIEKGFFGRIGRWIVVPVYSPDHELVDVVCREISGKTSTRYVVAPKPDGTRPLYSPDWERVKKSPYVYVVFGIFDSWAFESIGEPCVTGITGQNMPICLLEALGKRGIIVPDQNEAPAAHRLANGLGWRYRVKELDFPEGTKDPSGIHEMYGDDVLRKIIYT